MPEKHYDFIIVGAGICGCSVAYFLHQAKKRVLVIEKESIAAGGSGAAGAFIAPKFTRDPLQLALSQKAHQFALDFFNTNFPNCIQNRGLLHLATSEADAKKITFYSENNTHVPVPNRLKNIVRPEAIAHEHVYVKDAAIVDATQVCHEMLSGIDVVNESVESVTYNHNTWSINTFSATTLVFATGAYKDIISEPYLDIQGVWGHRINVTTTLQNRYNIHQKVSISPQQEAGHIVIGATHDRTYHPEHTKREYDLEAGRKALLENASYSVDLGVLKVLKDFTGLRASYYDHLPVVGPVVDAQKSIAAVPKLVDGVTPNIKALQWHQQLFMINGVGGYGFSFGPYMASLLANNLLQQTPINEVYQPVRLFKRWVKRVKK